MSLTALHGAAEAALPYYTVLSAAVRLVIGRFAVAQLILLGALSLGMIVGLIWRVHVR